MIQVGYQSHVNSSIHSTSLVRNARHEMKQQSKKVPLTVQYQYSPLRLSWQGTYGRPTGQNGFYYYFLTDLSLWYEYIFAFGVRGQAGNFAI